jgi:diaminopimelate epimerase
MKIHFSKYQGTGNDFVMIDNRLRNFDSQNYSFIKHLCNRRFGIGADGLILLEPEQAYDFRMVYYNADGHPGSMCGNGGRCAVQFAYDLGIIKNGTSFMAADGPHQAIIKDGLVHLSMKEVSHVETGVNYFFIDTGSPHYIKIVDNLYNFPVFEEGRKIRYSEPYKYKGTNVNFIEIIQDVLHVRTYERGVEDETYSCGTGVTASAIVASLFGMKSPVKVQTKGGTLYVSFSKKEGMYYEVSLIGPALKVFDGVLCT